MPAKRATGYRPQSPAVSVPRESAVETWRNVTEGMVVVNRTGEYGRRIHDLIHGGRAFQIAPQERRNMQNMCATPDYDMFTNGTLQPVTLLDDEPDTEMLKSNPNLLDERDVPKLLALRGPLFDARIDEVNHLPTITRLLALARESEYEMTVAQYETLKRREKAIRADREGLIEPDGEDTGEDVPRPVTPR
jgi:hypothetical protein